WEQSLDGCADEEFGATLAFDVSEEDRCLFPELADVERVFLCESDDGFVSETDEPEPEPEPEEDGPQEDDLVTEDHRHVYQNGKLVLTVAEDEVFRDALHEYMEREQFWPSVFFISDHGNAHLIDL